MKRLYLVRYSVSGHDECYVWAENESDAKDVVEQAQPEPFDLELEVEYGSQVVELPKQVSGHVSGHVFGTPPDNIAATAEAAGEWLAKVSTAPGFSYGDDRQATLFAGVAPKMIEGVACYDCGERDGAHGDDCQAEER